MYHLSIYKNNSSVDTLNKSLSLVSSLECDIAQEYDIYNPIFLVDENLVLTGNYAFCSELSLYYYITGQSIKGHLLNVTCECDYLMSFKNKILNGFCIAERSSSNYNMDLIDPLIPNKPLSNYYYLKFPYEFKPDRANIIMQIGGNRNA